jgi:hypothetical protein
MLAMAISPSARAAGPDVTSLMPSGGQRGTSVEVTATGNFPTWPLQTWVDRPGVMIAASGDRGKLTAVIAAEARPGLYWIRFHDANGAAPPQPFVVGTLPEIVEQEPNNTPQKAQSISLPAVVVNGRLNGDADLFSVPLKKGQTLVASLVGNETLGSPMDSVLQIVAPGGSVLDYNQDYHGLDPQIAFVAPADGSYLARVFAFPAKPNSTIGFAGGDSYVYRLTLTTGPFVDYPWPLAVTLGRESRVELVGWNIPSALASTVVRPEGETAEIFDPQLGNVVTLAVEPNPTLVEAEPNDAAMPQKIELPVTVSGRIEKRGDVDVFSFDAKQGESLVFQVQSRSLGFPLDAVLTISDAAGKVLSSVDDVGASRDPELAFSPPADGAYCIALNDLNHQGSPRHCYRLRATKAQSDFKVTADAHAYTVLAGKPSDVTLSIARQGGFAEEITFGVTGLPEFVTAAPAVSAAQGDSAKTVKLTLNAGEGKFSGPIRIVAQATGASQRRHVAGAAIPDNTARTNDLWLTVPGAASP